MSMPHQIPETFPTTIVDRFLSAFYTGKGDIMVQLEMHFDCSLDVEILRTAFALALDAEPILGCRFVVQKDSVVWQRLDADAAHRENFMVLSNENDYYAYRNKSLDPTVGPADHPPFFGIGMSGYDGTLTLAAAGYPETKDKVQKILEDMISELPV